MGVDEDLRAELLRRVARDQAARLAYDAEAARQADAENLPWLKQVIARAGWPSRSLVGEDGASAAWLLAQHADDDPAFQRHCLGLLTAAAAQGAASLRAVAYLTDRVLLAEGKPQEYGTQLTGRGGRYRPQRLRDPGGVDERRAAMSLGPLADYLADFAAGNPPPPSSTSCPACAGRIDFWPPDEEGSEITAECPACGYTLRMRLVGRPPAGS